MLPNDPFTEWPVRLDMALTRLGLVRSRTEAQREIEAGNVLVNNKAVKQARAKVEEADTVELAGVRCPYVSRGGLKLAAALDSFGIDTAGLRCLDIGSSTGGFTDCLLQRGARHVTGVDCGHGQLDPALQSDPRVDNREGVNARSLAPTDFDDTFDLIVVDVSFISATLILPRLAPLLGPGGRLIVLVKPQFEVGQGNLGKGGIVQMEGARQDAVAKVKACAADNGMCVHGVIDSPIQGGDGNREYLIYADRNHETL